LLRLTSVRPRAFGVAVALVALALAACGHSGSTPTSKATATPTPAATGTSQPACTSNSSGIAYLPDGANGSAFQGIQLVHFEAIGGQLCAFPGVSLVPFEGAVGPFWIAPDGSFAAAAYTTTGSPPFTQVQAVGLAAQGLIPEGAAYNVTLVPTPAPSVTPTAYPSVLPVLSDVGALNSIGTQSSGVDLVAGFGNGLLALNSLPDLPLQFGGFAPYQGATPGPGFLDRPTIAVSAETPPTTVLLRGAYDILGYHTTLVATGYQFKQVSQSTTLGYGAGRVLRGNGGMAINPAAAAYGIIIQAPSLNDVTALSNLPSAINVGSILALPSTPRSVAIATGGTIAVVGADNGFYVLSGAKTGALTLVHPFAPNPSDPRANAPLFVGCDGNTYRMTNVTSVRLSGDQRYLVVVGSPPGQVCAGGANTSLIALPFNTATGVQPTPSPIPTKGPTPAPPATPSPLPTAAPTMFTANGLINQPGDTDYLIVH
jgi:hypothetical protein